MSAQEAAHPSPPPPPSPPAPAVPPVPLWRRLWFRVVAGLFLLGSLGIALLPVLLSTGWTRGIIHSWLRDNVDRKVDFAELDVSWSDGVVLTELRVFDPEDPTRLLLRAPRIALDAPLLPLLRKRLEVKHFEVEDAILVVALDRDGGNNAEGVMKRRKAKGRRKDDGKGEDAPQAEDAPMVLPEITVPVSVRNLTLVIEGAGDARAEQPGITFDGVLTTRDGPTTFALKVPGTGGGSLSLTGQAKYFDAAGVELPLEDREVHAELVLEGLRAESHRELLSVFLPSPPALRGLLEGRVKLDTRGLVGTGDVDLRVADAALGDSVATRERSDADDLRITGRFRATKDSFHVEDFRLAAQGLDATANLGGGWSALEGDARMSLDLAAVAGSLVKIGVEVPAGLGGTFEGVVRFEPGTGRGKARAVLDRFTAPAVREGGALVEIERIEVDADVAASKDGFRVETFVARLPGMDVTGAGARRPDGSVDAHATASGDLGALLVRARDLGFLPSGLSLGGTVDAEVRVRSAPDGATAVDLRRLELSDEDVKVLVRGTLGADGALDFAGEGRGDLGRLLSRAPGDGPSALGALNGRFDFDARVGGTAKQPTVDVKHMRLEGDVGLDASGSLDGEGRVAARVDLASELPRLVDLARRIGALDRELELQGKLSASVTLAGTRDAPEIPEFKVALTDGPLRLDADGAISPEGALSGSASLNATLAEIVALARTNGFLDRDIEIAGRLAGTVELGGTRSAPAFPRVHLAIEDGPVTARVEGSLDAEGALQGVVKANAPVDELLKLAHAQGLLQRPVQVGGTLDLQMLVQGTRQEPHVPQSRLTIRGPLNARVDGKLAATGEVDLAVSLGGPLQVAADLAAAWSGEEPRTLDGTVALSGSVTGRRDRPHLRLGQIHVRAGGFEVTGTGDRDPDGVMSGRINGSGRAEDLLTLAQSFGVATDVVARGRMEFTADATMDEAVAQGSFTLGASGIEYVQPGIGGEPFNEPRLSLRISSVRYDRKTSRLEPVKVAMELDGGRIEATVEVEDRPAAAPEANPVRLVSLDGDLELLEPFSKNHPELLGGVTFQRTAGRFRFHGDVGGGRDNAADWRGDFDLEAREVVAPYVVASEARMVGRIDEGVARVEPLEARVNGGQLTANVRIGLVGERPPHAFDLEAREVGIDGSLAPLLARASPLFAIGENGTAGGKLSAKGDFTADGVKPKRIKKSLTGKGTMTVTSAFVESTGWSGKLLEFLGAGKRLEIATVTVPFDVSEGRVRTGELPLSSNLLMMRLGGEVGLDGELDYALRVKPAGTLGSFDRFKSALDADGYLPLRLEGTLSDPDLRLPGVKDLVGDGLKDRAKDLLDRLKGDGDKKDEEQDPPPKKGGKKGKKKDGGAQDDPPPPPPPSSDPPKDEPPPPPPPR